MKGLAGGRGPQSFERPMSASSSVRVRFAPSPTGYLHVGGARTLLFNWLYAKKTGGTLVLRIEDTDQARSTPEFEKMVLQDIARLGFKYQEGPDVGGPYPPYRQSERLKIYADHARKLWDQGLAYPCFCSDDLITQKRELAMKLGRSPHYDGTCAKISDADARARIKAGEKAGLRFKAPQKNIQLHDLVKGDVEFKAGSVGDFFITRSPRADESGMGDIGMPVYNFCCVVDDALMKMTHVIRGEDHLSNTARQILIYQAFGWELPAFAHTATVLGSDRQKLSKRSGDTSVHEYLDKGFVPEVLLNFLVLLGWWPANGTKTRSGHPEVFALDELVEAFNLDGLQKSPGVFDPEKLRWMNSYWVKHQSVPTVAAMARPFFERDGFAAEAADATWLEAVVGAVRSEVELLAEFPQRAREFLGGAPGLDLEAAGVLKEPLASGVVAAFEGELVALGSSVLTREWVEAAQKRVAEKTGAKGKGLFMPLRAVLTGKTHGPDLKQILPILGQAKTLARLQALKSQAGIS